MIALLAEGLIRRWVALYTRGLPDEVRSLRWDEIASDIWSQREDAMETGQATAALGVEMVARLIFGIPADVGWRLEQKGHQTAPGIIGRRATMGSRIVGIVAIFGGISLCVSVGLFAAAMLRQPDSLPWHVHLDPVPATVIPVLGNGGIFALAGAMVGLASLFSDRLHPVVALVAWSGAVGGGVGAFGAYAGLLLLPAGSAFVLLALARARLVNRWLAVAHLAGAIVFLVALWAMLNNERSGLFPLTEVYPLTWIGIGAAVMRGARASSPLAGRGI